MNGAPAKYFAGAFFLWNNNAKPNAGKLFGGNGVKKVKKQLLMIHD
jgi:hypothetical protein